MQRIVGKQHGPFRSSFAAYHVPASALSNLPTVRTGCRSANLGIFVRPIIRMPLVVARGILNRVELISRILSVSDGEIIYLGSASPPTSSGVPGAFCGTGRSTAPASPCSRWGLPGRRHCCPRRCALTAPFHPRILRCNLLSVALAVRLPCPVVNRHRRPVECGLSSTGTKPAAIPAFNPAA